MRNAQAVVKILLLNVEQPITNTQHMTQKQKLKEIYSNIKFILEKIKYEQHKWQIFGDFKVPSILLGQLP